MRAESKSLLLEGDSVSSRKVYCWYFQLQLLESQVILFTMTNQSKVVTLVGSTPLMDWRRFGNIELTRTLIFRPLIRLALHPLGRQIVLFFASVQETSLVAVDADGVGIGTTANGKKLRVVGDSDFSSDIGVGGTVNALAFVGDGQGLTNLNVSATGWGQVSGVGNTGIYDAALKSWYQTSVQA